MQHSGAGQPSVRSGKRMVAKGKTKESASNNKTRWQNLVSVNSVNMILKDWKAVYRLFNGVWELKFFSRESAGLAIACSQ